MAITKTLYPIKPKQVKKKKTKDDSFLDFLNTTDDEIKPTKIPSKKKKIN